MPLQVDGENYRTFSEPRIFEAAALADIAKIRDPVNKAYALLAPTTGASLDAWKFYSGDSTSADGFDVVTPSNTQVSGRWRRLGAPISVTSLGALGDGLTASATTNDTAFAAAVTRAAATGHPIYVPGGHYKITTDILLDSNVTIYGDGYSSRIEQTANNKNVIKAASKTNVLVSDLRLVAKGDIAANPDLDYNCALVLRSCTNSLVEACSIENYGYCGIFFYLSSQCVARGNRFPDATGVADASGEVQCTDIQIVGGQECTIEQNVCYSLGDDPGSVGIAEYGGNYHPTPVLNASAYRHIIRNNFVKRKTKQGIITYGAPDATYDHEGTQIVGNFVEDVDGSYLSPVHVGLNHYGQGIYVNGARKCAVNGNFLNRVGIYCRDEGTLVTGGIAVSSCSDTQVVGNYLNECYYCGIHMRDTNDEGDSATVAQIHTNKLANCGAYVAYGGIQSGQTALTLEMAGGFSVGDFIGIAGAGVAGATLSTTITAINGVNVVVADAASTTVASGKVFLEATSVGENQAFIRLYKVAKPSVRGNVMHLSGDFAGMRVLGIRLGSAVGDSMRYAAINDNQMNGCYIGIQAEKQEIFTVNGNNITNTAVHGILAEDTISSPEIRFNSISSATTTGIRTNSQTTFGMVEHNYITSAGTGLHITGSTLLRHNRLRACTTEYGNLTPIRTATNGDATPTMLGADFWIIPGAVTITALDDGNIGDVVTLRAGAAVVFTNSASLACRGGVDATLASTDTITFQKTGASAWTEIGRNIA